MILLDANILLYAYNSDDPQHRRASEWLRSLFAGKELIGLALVTLWAFLRVSTNARLWPNPKSAEESFRLIRGWLEVPGVVMVKPGPRHLQLLEKVMIDSYVTGSLVSDAVLAAIAIEHAATLASTDRDFRRFSGLRWVNPLE